ncbi:HAD-IIB family hydrolase [Erythrobacter litoralis]|uniref:HAD-IIB family hydrolase n=1 Tax=Erythrobacter litoralis TaxID=39960 RepID=UPI002435A861|nr:HAD-IIB family hydrolase [Erythrobacter litoralis]
MKAEPVRYGITEDTGGHIAYVLGEMQALSERADVDHAEIVTRLFDEPALDPVHAQPREAITPKLSITRIDSGNRAYLSKEALAADRKAFTEALISELRGRSRLPDVIHAHFADAADVAAKVEKALGIPFIYTAHSLGRDKQDVMGLSGTGHSARIAEETRAIERAAAIVGSSRDECERQIPSYTDTAVCKTYRIPPGILVASANDEAVCSASALIAPFLRDPTRPIVLAVARPVAKKNLATLVEAFGMSNDLRTRCNLVILAGVREGPQTQSGEQNAVMHGLFAAIDRHGLYGSVAYPKSHTREDVDGLYRLAAESGGVFVNPALMEPYGLTLVEAASYGLPVVATRNGGPIDIIGELKHGLLIDPTSPADLAGAIGRIIDDRELWQTFSRNGQANSQAMNWDAYADAFVSVARAVCETSPAQAERNFDSLLVSDIDNTLTGCPEGAGRFASFVHRSPGFAFAVATGRSLTEARRLIREWSLPEPVAWITSVGSEIYHRTSNGLEPDTDFASLVAEGWDANRVEDICATVPGLEPQAVYEQRPFKRSYFAASHAVAEAVRHALRLKGVAARVIYSHGRLLDVLPLRAGKGAAMAFLGRKLDIEAARIFAAGDSGNDEDMLTVCQNAILVGNHSDELAGLRSQPNVYVARRSHGSGALEGVLAHRRQRRRSAVRLQGAA